MSDIRNEFIKVLDAYIFSELYKRQAVKSKNFTFSTNSTTLTNRIMYIVKSMAVGVVKSNELEAVFTSVSFIRGRLKLSLSISNPIFLQYVALGYIKNFVGTNRWITYNQNSIVFDMNICVSNIFIENYGTFKNTKEQANEIINNVFFIQNAIAEMGKFLKVIKLLPADDLFKYRYLYYVFNYLNRSYWASENINIFNTRYENLCLLEKKEEILDSKIAFKDANLYTSKILEEIVTFSQQLFKRYTEPQIEEVTKSNLSIISIDECSDLDDYEEVVEETVVETPYIMVAGQRVAVNTHVRH